MPRQLTAAFVNSVKTPGKYFDRGGLGLALLVDNTGYKRWIQRIRVNGRQRDLGLGAPPVITLALARDKALENKRTVMMGGDPFADRKIRRNKLTFDDAAKQFFEKKKEEFRSDKHAKQWIATIDMYASPKLGHLFVDEITVQDIRRVLEPIWTIKIATASRLRQRIEAIMSWATVAGYRDGENPARWKGNLSELLPKPSKVQKAAHHPALSLQDAPEWWHDLSMRDGMGTAALQFLTLCASRSGEVRGMTWSEVQLGNNPTWTIPAARMKAERDHRVPLTPKMVQILSSLERHPDTNLVFFNSKAKPLSDMTLSATMKRIHAAALKLGKIGYLDAQTGRPAVPHGLRSTFRDWAAERGYDRDMAELQLAHTVGSDVERAYRRSDMLDRRRGMLEAWESFLAGEPVGKAVTLGRQR